MRNDNPCIESRFRTGKYQPDCPGRLDDKAHAERYRSHFSGRYNRDHHHRGIGYFTPAQAFDGSRVDVQRSRAAALDAANARHPERFVRQPPRPPALPAIVSINPVTAEAEDVGSAVNFPTSPKVRERLVG